MAIKALKESQTESDGEAISFGLAQNDYSEIYRNLRPTDIYNIIGEANDGDLTRLSRLWWMMLRFDPDIMWGFNMRATAPLSVSFDIYTWDSYRDENGFVVDRGLAKREDKKNVKILRDILAQIKNFDDYLLGLSAGIGAGFSLMEIADEEGGSGWKKIDGVWVPEFQQRNISVATPWRKNKNVLRYKTRLGGDEPFWPFGWVVHKHQAVPGYPHESGLFMALIWAWLSRMETHGDGQAFLHNYGIPKLFATFPEGTSKTDQRKLKSAMAMMIEKAYGIMPERMNIKELDAVKGQTASFINWYNMFGSLARRLLTGSEKAFAERTGVFSGGDMRNTEMWDLAVSDFRQYEPTTRHQLLTMLMLLNTGTSDLRRVPQIFFDISATEDEDKRVARDKELFAMGYRLKPESVAERYGDDYEDIGGGESDVEMPPQDPSVDSQPEDDMTDDSIDPVSDDDNESDVEEEDLNGE
jgi:phage gp29-like protein